MVSIRDRNTSTSRTFPSEFLFIFIRYKSGSAPRLFHAWIDATHSRSPLPVLLHLKVNGIHPYRKEQREERGSEDREGREEKSRRTFLLRAFLRIPLSKWSINYERPRRHPTFFSQRGHNCAGGVVARSRIWRHCATVQPFWTPQGVSEPDRGRTST